ncbi:MAG: hypothetical protein ACQUHE_08945, partial [Bacteroidia bacterium]
MKYLSFPVFVLLLISTISSCVILSPKKYKALLAKQDSLNTGWTESQLKGESLEQLIARLRKDTISLNGQIVDLKAQYTELDANYSKLRSN